MVSGIVDIGNRQESLWAEVFHHRVKRRVDHLLLVPVAGSAEHFRKTVAHVDDAVYTLHVNGLRSDVVLRELEHSQCSFPSYAAER